MAAPLIGRTAQVTQIRQLLAGQTPVLVTGVAGTGKTALLKHLADIHRGSVCWVQAQPDVPYSGLASLLSQLPDQPLPSSLRDAIDALAGVTTDALHSLRLRQAFLALLAPGLLIIDDANSLDEASWDVLSYVITLRGTGLQTLAATRSPSHPAASSRSPLPATAPKPGHGAKADGHEADVSTAEAKSGLPMTNAAAHEIGTDAPTADAGAPSAFAHDTNAAVHGANVGMLGGVEWERVRLGALEADQVAQLVKGPSRVAGQIYAGSGGNPRLALLLAEGEPGPIREAVAELLLPLSASAIETLGIAAVARQPTVRLLQRAGRTEAADEIAAAVEAGLAGLAGERIFLSAGAVAAQLVSGSSGTWHEALADVADDPVVALWHRACVRDTPDDGLSAHLVPAAGLKRSAGDLVFAAELALRAADLASSARELTAEIACAARDAAAGGRADLVRRAVAVLETTGAARAELVQARLAVVDAAGQALDGLDEMLAQARTEATGSPQLLAQVHLRLALRANLSEGSPEKASRLATQAAEHARAAKDPAAEAMALTMVARMRRILGDPEAESVLAQALALPAGPALRDTARYLAIRHAVFDDQLSAAHDALQDVLPSAAALEDRVDILRGLAEVEVRLGRCALALEHAYRAISISEQASLSPGPSWYTAAVAELAGGTAERAAEFAAQAIRASQEEHDQVYLARTMHISGLIQLMMGQAGPAAATLRQVRALEQAQQVGDPSLLRWHGDLAEALVAVGELTEAFEIITHWRSIALHLNRNGVLAALGRAEGAYLSAHGDGEGAVELLSQSASSFGALGLPLEQARSLIGLAVAERRRRRRAAAREAQRQAVSLLDSAGAYGLRPFANVVSTSDHDGQLTGADARVATLVADGASNREIAAALFLSVKTVEAMLTRIYRRLGVRSRTQLVTVLRQ